MPVLRYLAAGILVLPLGVRDPLAHPLAAQQPATLAALRDSLDQLIRRGMHDWRIPGLSVAVVRNDSVLMLRGYGVRRHGAPDPVDEHTLFGIMSTTKAMTAMGIALLVEDGVLQWSDPVTKWAPAFAMPEPYVTRELTVLDLLTHRAGLGNADLLWLRWDLDDEEIFRRVRHLEPAYSFRAGYGYQNIMFGLAGHIIERAAGMPWAEFTRKRLWEPLGMTRTFGSWRAVAERGGPNVSAPHTIIRDTLRAITEDPVDAIPAAGAVWSTAADMARWLRYLLDSTRVNGQRLLSHRNFQRLFQPHTFIAAERFYPSAIRTRPRWTAYGAGWFLQDYRGAFAAFHTGSLDGRIAIVGLLPEQRFGVAMLANMDGAEFRHALMLKAFDLQLGDPSHDWNADLLALYDSLDAQGDSARAAREAARVSGTTPRLPLAQYAGTYRHPVWGDLVVRLDGGRLAANLGDNPELAGPLAHWHYDTFRTHWGDGRAQPGWLSFGIGPDGSVSTAWLGYQDPSEFVRVAPAQAQAAIEATTTTAADSLRLTLELPARVGAGQAVPIQLRVENVSGRPLDLYLRGRSVTFDLVVADQGGAVVWRRLENEVIPAAVRIEVLPPGGRLDLEATWNQRSNDGNRVRPGSYTVRGELLTETVPLVAAPRPLVIEGRP